MFTALRNCRAQNHAEIYARISFIKEAKFISASLLNSLCAKFAWFIPSCSATLKNLFFVLFC